ncbi:hypothetical protein AJ80_02407 [Polytolypa hystricis UAMH7299]|uniref:Uncharacterized protein n=1 Tax=Polytolypa hystricis (strain UAMH7299) TaxID=1447883 RepID=A0A2B7YH96_POLH7|nr:hypothetical protein AJ80_02407 [Polytolypa hystricis UAMH7299]
MSTSAYLRQLLKGDLLEIAESTGLTDYEGENKKTLEELLDNHLRGNQSALYTSDDKRLVEYFRRLSRSSPVKRETRADATTPGTEVRRTQRARRQTKPREEEIDNTDESEVSSVSDKSSPTPARTAARTPARPSLISSLPPSPAVVTDAIDRQTTRVREHVSSVWDTWGLTERSHALRSLLSSVRAIETLILVLELSGVYRETVPMRYLTTFPAVQSLRSPSFAVKIPDLFVLVSSAFWAPFLLWLSTSLLLPSLAAYFFNLSLKVSQQAAAASPTHTYGTRRSSAAATAAAAAATPEDKSNFDPLVFNVAKALISYLVYANNFTFWDLFHAITVRQVPTALPGGLPGLLTGSAIGTLGSLYEAILKK